MIPQTRLACLVLTLASAAALAQTASAPAPITAEDVSRFREAAAAGNLAAMHSLGVALLAGRGADKDPAAAAEWFRKAADAGHVPSMLNLGLLLKRGEGVPRDADEARKLLTRVAESASPLAADAMIALGGLALDASPRDSKTAAEWFQKAADKGDAAGLYNLGLMHERGLGIAAGATRAMELYVQAAEKGSASAMFNLGAMYATGRGAEKSAADARNWFEKAAARNHGGAMNYLGIMYVNGLGVEKDFARALTWWTKAADAGDLGAMTNLGLLYFRGTGVEKNVAAAVEWWTRAADAGHAPAMNLLAAFYLRPDKGDEAESLKWYRKSAALNDTAGLAGMGRMYEEGRAGLDRNVDEARTHYRKAIARGGPGAEDAERRLAKLEGRPPRATTRKAHPAPESDLP